MQSVDYQKVLMSWEIGKEIELHLKEHNTSGYGEQLFFQLSRDTKIEKTALYKMRAFYKSYPKIPQQKKALSWSHYRSLIAVKDSQTRAQLENLVVQQSLGSNRLQKEVTATKKKEISRKESEEKNLPLKVTRGKIGTYVLNENGELDLGFNVLLKTTKKVSAAKKSDYTYKAELERVVDGDTIHVKIDLGFGIFHREILRLAKINAAESDTPEGKKATACLKKILESVPFLIVKTNKTDIYGRYVADVFLAKKNALNSKPQQVANQGEYLNQTLLDLKVVQKF